MTRRECGTAVYTIPHRMPSGMELVARLCARCWKIQVAAYLFHKKTGEIFQRGRKHRGKQAD